MNPLKLAVVGLGLIGKKHAAIIQKNQQMELCGIVENNKLQIKNANIKSKFFDNIQELLNSEKPDGAIIATPTPLHLTHAKIFIEKKIPILIEKPISNSSIETSNLLKLAKKNSTKILVGHHRRHNNIIKSAKKALEIGSIGKIRSVFSICWFYKPDKYFNKAPWRKKIGAGPISINLVHDIDLLRYFCGEVKNVQATTSPSSRGYENEDIASIILNFDTGVIANMSVSDSIVSPWSWEMNSKENSEFPYTKQNCYIIGGSKGSLSIPDLKIWSNESIPDWENPFKTEILKFEHNDPLVDQMKHFCDVINKKVEPLVSGEEGLKSIQVVEAIDKSSKLKKNISI